MSKLTEQPVIPFDREKQTYRISETIVPESHTITAGNDRTEKRPGAEQGFEHRTAAGTAVIRQRTTAEALQ